MGVLSTQLRCNQCGARNQGPSVTRCPNCQAELSQVGVWGELLEWGRIRERGRKRFVWLHCVLWWAGVLWLGLSLGYFLFKGERNLLFYLVTLAMFGLCGYIYGRLQWRFAERQYLAAMQGGNLNHSQIRRPAHW